MNLKSSPEFDVIQRFFNWECSNRLDLGVGDDCAILNLEPSQRLCFSMDTLVEGVHFLPGAAASMVASRALCTALSDLAAMGARPHHFTLSLTLPSLDLEWLALFSKTLRRIADTFDLVLAGGDTTRGPLAVCIQVHGLLPSNEALLRSGAKVGDRLFVSGCLGDAAGGLACLQEKAEWNEYLVGRFEEPLPKISLGEYLRPVATSAIDISDGLLADLEHLACASQCAVALDATRVPISKQLQQAFPNQAQQFALSGGDDYELAFTLPKDVDSEFLAGLEAFSCVEVGDIHEGAGVSVIGLNEKITASGYDHFAEKE